MVKEISNKMISTLLVVALFVTVLGTFVTINRLARLGDQYESLTGFALNNASGDAQLEVLSITSITNNVQLIDFGSGYVSDNCTECVMDSRGQTNQTGPCCLGFRNVSRGFLIENTGNQNISLNFTCDGPCNATNFIGGTNPAFEFKTLPNAVANESNETSKHDTEGSCSTPEVANFTHIVYRPVNNTGADLCGNSTHFPFGFKQEHDAMAFDINLSIPENADTDGQKTVTFNFTATSQG